MTAKEVTTVPFAPGPPPTCSSRQGPLPWCACAHVSVRRGRPPSAPAALRPWRDLPRMGAERNMAAVVRDRDGALLVRPTHTHLCTRHWSAAHWFCSAGRGQAGPFCSMCEIRRIPPEVDGLANIIAFPTKSSFAT